MQILPRLVDVITGDELALVENEEIYPWFQY